MFHINTPNFLLSSMSTSCPNVPYQHTKFSSFQYVHQLSKCSISTHQIFFFPVCPPVVQMFHINTPNFLLSSMSTSCPNTPYQHTKFSSFQYVHQLSKYSISTHQ